MQREASPQSQRPGVTLSITGAGGAGTPESGGGPLHGGLVLLGRFTAEVDDPALPAMVRLSVVARDGWLACESVTVTARPGGPPVTGTTLRAPRLAAYLDQARAELGAAAGGAVIMRVARRSEHAIAYELVMPPEWDAFDFAQRRKAAKLTPELAAACYQEILGDGDPERRRRPTAEVAKRLNASRGHISRLLTEARRQGILGAATPGRAG